eukprot:CAMPEP_0184482744 /NCGR_PEP_ID=MMETSP0113_2-20130426/4323_1 /TAXON_ID=91329 /ORGANISM="Norrisiella sphaerica, Strain BC52" /LENGTH=319 /DNA_ID=CAMNT_0026862665 /DNA_START=85 /DNA_END=1042 /DNA_ORIENTATION=-
MAVDRTDVLAASVILFCGLGGVLFPFIPSVRDKPHIQRAGEAHSAGLFLSLALCHMLDDSINGWNAYKRDTGMDDHFPYPFMVAGVAFIVIMSLDLLQAKITRGRHSSSASGPGLPKWVSLTLGVSFALVAPIAVLSAAALGARQNGLAVALIQATAAGTFLYLACESMQALKPEHGHHNHDIDTSSVGKALFCFAFLSVHSILDGLVIAAGGSSNTHTWVLCVAIAFHKLWAALALGFKLQAAARSGNSRHDRHEFGQRAELLVVNDDSNLHDEKGGYDSEDDSYRADYEVSHAPSCVDYVAFLVGFAVLAGVAAVIE